MKGQKRQPDFSGWATKYGIKCSDGRTILPGAFSDMDGKKVPIVFGHIHDDPDMVLGHAYLYSRPEGIWTEGYFNENPKAKSTMGALQNGDLDGLSIYANELKHVNGRQVQHGNIRELSVVLAGANKGATIENVLLAHGDLLDELDDEAIIYNDDVPISHDDYTSRKQKRLAENKEEEDDMATNKGRTLRHSEEETEEEEDDFDLEEVWNSMTPEQQELCALLVEDAENGGDDDEE